MDSSSPEEVDAEHSLMSVYNQLVKKFGWSLNDIDQTNLETLIDFLFFSTKADPNVRIINGKEYRRATKVPSWL